MLVTATVSAPVSFAAAKTMCVSVDIPLCDIARTMFFERLTLALYTVVIDGVNLETMTSPMASTIYLK